MNIILQLLLLTVGFVMLVKGSDWFVDGAASIAAKFRIPQIIIGLTVVAMGTSAPEAAVSITAASAGSADITVGNIVGSNILNVLVILGLSAAIIAVPIGKSTQKVDAPFMIAISGIFLALGWDGVITRLDGVILLGDCVDVYSPKVVRAAMGSLFSTKLYAMTAQQLKEQLDGMDIPLYAATLASDSQPVTNLDLKRSCVIIGNEAHGVSPETAACCTGSVIVPIQSAESLNAGVAAGILMWEMRR